MDKQQIAQVKKEYDAGLPATKGAIERLFPQINFEPNEYLLGEELMIRIAVEVTDIDKYSKLPYEITTARVGDEEDPLMVQYFSAEELNKLVIKEQ